LVVEPCFDGYCITMVAPLGLLATDLSRLGSPALRSMAFLFGEEKMECTKFVPSATCKLLFSLKLNRVLLSSWNLAFLIGTAMKCVGCL
jgi:hypothetical protein